jgi:hypothetical protein
VLAIVPVLAWALAWAPAPVLAGGDLRAALASGRPFETELRTARPLASGETATALDAIAPFAAHGIPTAAQLIARFQPLPGDVLRAARLGDSDEWLEQVKGRLAALIIVRRQGADIPGNDPDALVARAEAAVNRGDLADAVDELSRLQGSAGVAAAGWLNDAKGRLAADAAERRLGAP